MNITPEIETRLHAILKYSSTGMTIDMLKADIEKNGMDPDLYCDLTEMQIAFYEATKPFLAKWMKPDNSDSVLARIAGAAAAGIASHTHDKYLMDERTAIYTHAVCLDVFARMLAAGIRWHVAPEPTQTGAVN